MKAEYIEYIQRHHSRYEDCYGKCQQAAKAMQHQFPELRIALGHVETALWGLREHAWLVTADGEIVDPTAKQFPGILSYDEWKPGGEIEVGRCMNCGETIYEAVQSIEDVEPKSICSDECAESFRRSLL